VRSSSVEEAVGREKEERETLAEKNKGVS